MRKIIMSAVIISLLLVMSCRSAASITDETFKQIYSKYKGSLILDGAGKYTVASGDTLSSISRAQYNDGFYYPVIMLASNEVVVDPDKIQPGMVLTIPNLQRNLNDEGAKRAMKGVILDCAKIEDSRKRADVAKGLREQARKL